MSQEDIYDESMLEANQAFTNAILGPPMAGCLVGVLLAGAFLQQYFNYLGGNLYKRDSFKLKCFLHVVIALATVQSALTFFAAYHYSTWQQRDSATLFAQTITDCMTLTFVGVEGALVQLFLAHRGTALLGASRWRWVYWTFVGASVAGGLGGSVLYLTASVLLRDGRDPQFFNVASGLYQICGAFVNTLITVTLCTSLWHNMTSFNKKTDSILAAIMRVSVQSAAPTAFVAVIGATLGFVFDDQSLFANVTWAFFQTLTGLYALSLLATLNGRETVRAVSASESGGAYCFNRDTITTVEGPALSRGVPAEEGEKGSYASSPRLEGRSGPADSLVAVGWSSFLQPDERCKRSRSRLEKGFL